MTIGADEIHQRLANGETVTIETPDIIRSKTMSRDIHWPIRIVKSLLIVKRGYLWEYRTNDSAGLFRVGFNENFELRA